MKLRIGTQLAAAFAIPILALALIVAAVLLGFAHLAALRDDLSAKSTFRAQSRDVGTQMLQVRFAQRGFAISHAQSDLDEAAKAIGGANDDIAYLRAHLATVPSAASDLDTISAVIARVGARRQSTSAAGDKQTALEIRAKNTADFQTAQGALDAIIAASTRAYNGAVATFDAQMHLLTILMLAIGAVTIGASVAVTLLLSRRMSTRLGRVSHALEAIVREDFEQLSGALGRMAAGDLRASFRSRREAIPDHGHDEIGELVGSYNVLAEGLARVGNELTAGLGQLRELIGGVVTASRALALASDQTSAAANQASTAVEQIAQAVESVAGGARDQAMKIAQASAAIEELARSAEMIADGA
ncbi:MAG TPA: HAMP domain-containing protein, partial [Candidatus Limnocylindria bacterium]|nr:HAMP domain-containing protein [Candidatus Limnocylindria bacterium]